MQLFKDNLNVTFNHNGDIYDVKFDISIIPNTYRFALEKNALTEFIQFDQMIN